MKNTAHRIVVLFSCEFRGKPKGRFALTRTQLKQIMDVPLLRKDDIEKLSYELRGKGLVLIDLDETFVIMELDVLEGYRRPTKELIETVIAATITE